MANSYIAIPNVLPGNVTIGGNLTVAGNELTVGSFAAKLHLAMDAINIAKLTYNIKQGGNTRDDASRAGVSLGLPFAGTQPELQVINSAGNSMDNALLANIFTDYTDHVHTGTTTDDTIYSKTIRANLLGLNGGVRITVGLFVGSQAGVQTNLRVKLAGATVGNFGIVAADLNDQVYIQFVMGNKNSVSSQVSRGFKIGLSGVSTGSLFGGGVNTSIDQALTVTVLNGTSTDSQTINFITVELMNTYGPVT